MTGTEYIVLKRETCDRCDGTGHELNGAVCARCDGARVLFDKVTLANALISLGVYDRFAELERTVATLNTRLEAVDRRASYAANYADHVQGLSRG